MGEAIANAGFELDQRIKKGILPKKRLCLTKPQRKNHNYSNLLSPTFSQKIKKVKSEATHTETTCEKMT